MTASSETPSLHLFCGKMAAGKSTLARELAARHSAVLISEDEWLSLLYPEGINTFQDYLTCSSRLKRVLKEHIRSLLAEGVSVILDFPGNTKTQRAWLRSLYIDNGVDHVLHYVDRTNADCLVQLKKRNKEKSEGSKFTTPEEFMMVTGYFEPPLEAEGFNIHRH